jgi:hypothetical protein
MRPSKASRNSSPYSGPRFCISYQVMTVCHFIGPANDQGFGAGGLQPDPENDVFGCVEMPTYWLTWCRSPKLMSSRDDCIRDCARASRAWPIRFNRRMGANDPLQPLNPMKTGPSTFQAGWRAAPTLAKLKPYAGPSG